MNDIVIISVLMAIGVGIAIGIGIVIIILITRVNPTFNSLESIQDYAGCVAEVMVAITPDQFGSIRVRRNSKTLKLWAGTHDSQSFRVGDQVVIVEIENSQAWVTSAQLDD